MISTTTNGAICYLTLSRAPVNAFNVDLVSALASALGGIEADRSLAVVVIRSDQKVFSAGADLVLMRNSFDVEGGTDTLIDHVRRMQRLFDRIERLPQVTIASIGGSALGGGLELALSCDLRIAADEAVMGLPEARLGLLPGAGGTQRLTRLCGPGVSRRLILGGETVRGAMAAALGVVQWSYPALRLANETHALAERVSALLPEALAACKRCLALADADSGEGFALELAETRSLLQGDGTQGRVRTFFSQKGQK